MYSFDFPLKEPCDFEKIDSKEDRYCTNWNLTDNNKKGKGGSIWFVIIGVMCLIFSFVFFAITLSMSLNEVSCAEEPSAEVPTKTEIQPVSLQDKSASINRPIDLKVDSVSKTLFDSFLEDNGSIKALHDAFVNETDNVGNRIYPDEFIVGLIANIENEGSPGVVESAFSVSGAYDFKLPSGGKWIKTEEDINYLICWTTERCVEDDESVSKGSCGVSSIQWSFERRLKWLKLLQNETANKKPINEDTFLEVDKQMFLQELKPNSKYYNKIFDSLPVDASVEDYAEAICDYYVCPSHSCGCMDGSGDSCKERRKRAKELWDMKFEIISEDLSN